MDGALINSDLQRPSQESKTSVPLQVQQESQTGPVITGRSSSATASTSGSYDPRTDKGLSILMEVC
jgi:hypothetical protein